MALVCAAPNVPTRIAAKVFLNVPRLPVLEILTTLRIRDHVNEIEDALRWQLLVSAAIDLRNHGVPWGQLLYELLFFQDHLLAGLGPAFTIQRLFDEVEQYILTLPVDDILDNVVVEERDATHDAEHWESLEEATINIFNAQGPIPIRNLETQLWELESYAQNQLGTTFNMIRLFRRLEPAYTVQDGIFQLNPMHSN